MIGFPWLSPAAREVAFPGMVGDTDSNLNLGGLVTGTNWVEFFLSVSALSLVAAFLFARQGMSSNRGTPAMLRMVAATKEGAKALLKRRYRSFAAMLGLLLPTYAPTIALAQPEQAGGGGEANLILPDLTTVHFF